MGRRLKRPVIVTAAPKSELPLRGVAPTQPICRCARRRYYFTFQTGFSKVKSGPGPGEATLSFESQQVLSLLQAPSSEHVFSFKPADASANAGLKLPYATARGTRVDTISGKRRMYSDIYGYL